MSQLKLARAIGVTERLVHFLEGGGPIDGGTDWISLRTLDSVASTLGLDVSELLPARTADGAATDNNAQADAALVANILDRVGAPVTFGHLATALEWDGARLNAALEALQAALPAAGRRLRASPEGLTLAPSPDTIAQTAAAEIKQLMVGEDQPALELIWKVFSRGRRRLDPSELTNTERVVANRLLASHVLSSDASGNLTWLDGIREALAPAMPERVFFHPGEY